MNAKIAKLAAVNAFCAALVAISKGEATREQLATVAATGSTYTKKQAQSTIRAMIRNGWV